MQNLMPQLDLSGKMVQQQPRSSQSSEKSASRDGGKDDFRSLLENPSNGDVLKEKEGTEPQLEFTEEKTVKLQDHTVKKNDAADEEFLQGAGIQPFQMLMMGSSQLEDLRITSELPGSFVQIQPEIESSPEILPLQDLTAGLPEMADLGEENGMALPVQALEEEIIQPDHQAEAAVVAERQKPQADVKRGESAGQQQVERTLKAADPKEDSKPEKTKAPERNGKAETVSRSQAGDRQAVNVVRQPQQDEGKMEMDLSGRYDDTQAYAVQGVSQQESLQQGLFQVSFQEKPDTAPVIHVQVSRPQELMGQLLDQIKGKVSLGDQEFEVQLHPENLGKLAIKVAYTAEKVSISIVCSNTRTMELLSSGAKNIAQIMEENLGAPTTVMVDQEEGDYLEQYNGQEDPRQQQQEPEKKKKKSAEDEHQDFLQQLRLGLI